MTFEGVPPILYTVGSEYSRVLEYAFFPALAFTVLGPIFPFPAYPPVPFPSFVFLGLLCLLSCFALGHGEVDGYFAQPATSWEKGVLLVGIKALELTAEYLAYLIFVGYGVKEPLISAQHSVQKNLLTILGVQLLAIHAIAALRTFLIFPWIMLSMRWAYKLPSCWLPYPQKTEH